MEDAKVFSKINSNTGFWRISLTEDSKLLRKFFTPFGKWCFKRHPLNLASAPEEFQNQISGLLGEIKPLICHFDDETIFERSLQETRTWLVS